MSDGPEMDWTEFDKVTRDLGEIPYYSGGPLRTAFFRFSETTRQAWMSKLQGSGALPHLPYFVDYTVTTDSASLNWQTEIGFKKAGSGHLGNISEYGTPRAAGKGYGLSALQENEEDLDRGIDAALEEGRKRAGF